MIEPLHLSLELDCDVAHAFAVFTDMASSWWPRTHSVSQAQGLTVVFEPRPGGRIFERAPDGTEYDWGEVVLWEPPTRLGYLWHLRADRTDATDVHITFTPLSDHSTRIDIVHGGWDRLDERGPSRREANQKGWGGLLPHYLAACTRRSTATPLVAPETSR
ncbi:MAG: SRPBCC domain-containing protein [Acidobacteriota bacterium]|nr:SRPBCC domain-containing protein [Acidobacteriota bacterium]